MQRIANLVDLEKCRKMSIYLQKSASIQPRTSLFNFNPAQEFNFPIGVTPMGASRGALQESRFCETTLVKVDTEGTR